jgi:lipopolysaccharide biosynthesis glycosyltransferase
MDPKCFTAHDQDVLNLVFDGNYVLLPKIFNYMGGMDVKIQKDIIIYHFFGRIKPWDICLTDYDKVWRKYCEISFWDTIEDPLPQRESKYYADFNLPVNTIAKNGQYLKALNVIGFIQA